MNVNTENEHILVCLSSSPSNKNIIFTASKMANALQAQFTALYVQKGSSQKIKKGWMRIFVLQRN